MQLVVINQSGALEQEAASALAGDTWSVTEVPDYSSAARLAQSGLADAVLVFVSSRLAPHLESHMPLRLGADQTTVEFVRMLRVLETQHVATLLVCDDEACAQFDVEGLLDILPTGISARELHGRLETIARYQRVVRRLEKDVRNLERIGKRLNERFVELDQEMRLASRLQHDFLPDLGCPIADIHFAALFQPATWVSGDIYDVIRVDEEHVAFYIADAVGHGMAASLLTMFIKRSIVPKRIVGDCYEIVRPGQVITLLNRALCDQALPNCQFVTAWYGLLNTRTLELVYARGGHPHPILFGDCATTELKSGGGLLGLFGEEEYTDSYVQLRPGDRLLLFTDGVELAFQPEATANSDPLAYRTHFERIRYLNIETAMAELERNLDAGEGSLSPRDDVTILGVQIPEVL